MAEHLPSIHKTLGSIPSIRRTLWEATLEDSLVKSVLDSLVHAN